MVNNIQGYVGNLVIKNYMSMQTTPDRGFNPWVRRTSYRRRKLTALFLPEKNFMDRELWKATVHQFTNRTE